MQKLYWRQHEIILATFLTTSMLAWKTYELYQSISLVPEAVNIIILYGAYMLLNLTIIPLFTSPQQSTSALKPVLDRIKYMRAAAWLTSLFLIVILLQFLNYYFLVYPSANFKTAVQSAPLAALRFFLLYGSYVLLREILIYRALLNGKFKRSMILNRFSLTLTVYGCFVIALYFLVPAFHYDSFYPFILFSAGFGLPAIIAFFGNMYFIFPLPSRWSRTFLLLLTPLVLALLSSFICGLLLKMGDAVIPFFLICLGILLIIVIPLSWGIYLLVKQNIITLLKLESSLDQSKAELSSLRAQIHPHFLFNTLNTIYGSALRENAPATATGIQQLGDMMRFVMEETNQDRISLDEEISYLSAFIELQKMRIRNAETSESQAGPDWQIDLPERTYGLQIAPMLLIPIIENCFKHGISPDGAQIRIDISCDEHSLRLATRNNIFHPEGSSPGRPGIGLKNVKRRLELLYPGRHQFTTLSKGNQFLTDLVIYL